MRPKYCQCIRVERPGEHIGDIVWEDMSTEQELKCICRDLFRNATHIRRNWGFIRRDQGGRSGKIYRCKR